MKFFIIKTLLLAIIAVFAIFNFANAQTVTSTSTSTPFSFSATTPPEIQAMIDKAQAEALSKMQSMLNSGAIKTLTEKFSVEFSPQNPGANARVSAQVVSYSFDVNYSKITWTLNKKYAGTGKSFSFITGPLGSISSLKVNVITPDGASLNQSFSFQAADVDLLWETSTYTPLSYRGKALAVTKSPIKVTAFPQGMKTADSNLIYEWERNEKNAPEASGPAKKTFSFFGTESGQEFVKVRVSTPDKSAIAENSILISINDPKILFYEENPLEGPQYQTELGNTFNLENPQLILRAEPFFFSKRALPILSYEWRMNGKKIKEADQKPNILNLAAPKDAKGSSLVQLSLINLKNVFEMAEKNLQINFNQNQ